MTKWTWVRKWPDGQEMKNQGGEADSYEAAIDGAIENVRGRYESSGGGAASAEQMRHLEDLKNKEAGHVKSQAFRGASIYEIKPVKEKKGWLW